MRLFKLIAMLFMAWGAVELSNQTTTARDPCTEACASNYTSCLGQAQDQYDTCTGQASSTYDYCTGSADTEYYDCMGSSMGQYNPLYCEFGRVQKYDSCGDNYNDQVDQCGFYKSIYEGGCASSYDSCIQACP